MVLSRKTIVFVLLSLCAFPLIPYAAHAQTQGDLTVTPVVVDEKAKARDILKENITITNTSKRKLSIYPSVNDVSKAEGQEQFVSAQSGDESKDSLANWIELSRGVIELNPGESKEIPFVIRVNMNALPGTYHAEVSLYEGSTRVDAESRRPLSVVTVNTEVQADIKEQMQLNKFITDSFFFSGDDVLFNFQLENIGNQELKPKGEIRIYDRKGREVASVPVNPEGKTFTPDQAAQLASAWTSAQGFGKFKAFLNIDYGNNQSGSLQDTVFFWIIPWQQLLAIFVVSLIAIIVSALYFHRWLEHRHMQRFALAGLGAGGGAAALQAPLGMLSPVQKPVQKTEPQPVAAPAPVASIPEEKKRGFFSRFRFRRAKKDAVETAAPAVAAALAPETPAPAAPQAGNVVVHEEPTREAPAKITTASHTIDLTGAQSVSPQPRREGHVINLKNGA